MKTLTTLRNPQVFKLWLSQVLSSIGDNFYDMTLVWITTREIGAAAGLIVLVGSLSTLIFGIPGGVWVDRWDRRLTMALVDTICMIVLLLLVLVTVFGEIQLWHLAIVTAINVGLNALFQPALIASVRIVSEDRSQLQAVNALMDVTSRVARAIAPAMAGILLAIALPQHLFFLDALTFGVSALAIFSLSQHFAWKPEKLPDASGNDITFWGDVKEGWRVLQSHAVLRWILPMKTVVNAFWGIAFVIGIPLLVDASFSADPRNYGYIFAAYGFGSVVGNLVIGSLTIKRRAFVMFSGMIILGAGFVLLAWSPSLPFAIVAIFLASLGAPMEDLMMLLYMQEDIPDNSLGKIYSLRVVLSELGYSFGVASAALIYGWMSVPMGMTLAALAVVACGSLGVWRFGLSVYEPKPVTSA
ncbi:MAG: MFS transporter [Chloroflexota bacterium]